MRMEAWSSLCQLVLESWQDMVWNRELEPMHTCTSPGSV